jgi:hypothetical protein
MTPNFTPIIEKFEAYLSFESDGNPNPIQYAGDEVLNRLRQMGWLCHKIRMLEVYQNELLDEFQSGQWPSEGLAKDHPILLRSRSNMFELQIMVESFYYFAFRSREVIRILPGLKNFECEGIRNVRNHLLEHPENPTNGAIAGAFGFDNDASGPKIKMVRFPSKNEKSPDNGLWINSIEFIENLSLKLNAATERAALS